MRNPEDRLETNVANTKDWITATKSMKISAYIEARAPSALKGDHPFTKADFEQALRKISRPKESPHDEEKSET